MTNNKEYVSYSKSTGFVTAALVVTTLIRFAQLPVLTKTKWLDASLYGDWSLIYVSIALLTPIAALAMESPLIRFLAGEKSLRKIREDFMSVVFTVIVSGALLSLVFFLCSNIFASTILGDIEKSHLVKLASIAIFTESLAWISIVFFRALNQIKWYSILLVLKPVVELVLTVVFLSMGWGIEGLIYAILASDVLLIVLASYMVLRRIGFQLPRFTRLKKYLKYGLPLLPNEAMIWIIQFSDRYMIGYFMEDADVGIYTAAYRICNIIYLITTILRVALFPTISRLYDEGATDKTKTYLKYSIKYLMILSMPAAAGISILAAPLLGIFSEAEFVPGSVVMPYVTSGLVIFGFYHICVYIIHLTHKTYWVIRLLGISAVLNFGLNLLLIPRFGIVGAAAATLIAYGVLGILTLLISFKYIKFDLSFLSHLKSLTAAALMALVIWLIDPTGWAMVLFSIILGIIIYFTVLFFLKGFTKNELRLFKDLILRRNTSNS